MTLGGPGPGDGVGRGDRPRPTRVVVVGGANVDIVARAGAGVVAGSSTPGQVVSGDGGVARNIAENLARLATPVLLVAPIGPDDAGAGLRARCAAIGIDTRALIAAPQPTGRYVAVLDRDGELLAGINDMRAVEALTPADVDAVAGDLTGSDVVVLDANLPTPVLATLARAAAAVGAPVVAEPVSVAKAPRILTALQPRPGRGRRAGGPARGRGCGARLAAARCGGFGAFRCAAGGATAYAGAARACRRCDGRR